MATINQRQSGHIYSNVLQRQNANQNVLTCRNFWQLLINYSVPRNEIDDQPIKMLLELLNRKNSRSDGQKPDSRHINGQLWTFTQFPDLSQFTEPELHHWIGDQVTLRKNPKVFHRYTLKCIPTLSEREWCLLAVRCGRKIFRRINFSKLL